MRKYIVPFLAGGLLATAVNADQAIFDGYGYVSMEPESAEFSIVLEAKCHPSRRALTDAVTPVVNALKKEIEGIVKRVADGANPQVNYVTTSAGTIGSYSNTIYTDEGKKETVCSNSFQQKVTLKISTSGVDQFSDIHNTIGAVVDEITKGLEGGPKSPSIHAHNTEPQSVICTETRMRARDEALKMSAKDAVRQFREEFERFGVCLANVKMVGSEPVAREGDFSSYEAKSMSAPARSGFDVDLPNIVVEVLRRYTFKYDNACPFKGEGSNLSSSKISDFSAITTPIKVDPPRDFGSSMNFSMDSAPKDPSKDIGRMTRKGFDRPETRTPAPEQSKSNGWESKGGWGDDEPSKGSGKGKGSFQDEAWES